MSKYEKKYPLLKGNLKKIIKRKTKCCKLQNEGFRCYYNHIKTERKKQEKNPVFLYPLGAGLTARKNNRKASCVEKDFLIVFYQNSYVNAEIQTTGICI